MTSFDYKIIRLLPRNWVSSFRAYEALEFFDVDDFVSMTYNHLSLEQTQSIMKVCIKSSRSEEEDDDIPYKVLKVIKSQKRDIDKIARSIKELEKGKFNGEMYYLTRSTACNDQECILHLFCDEPARIIQQAWKAWKKYQYIQAIKKIQRWVIEWLYKPYGPMMKKAEARFNTLA
ncbi:unnamed protein product [Rhizophagus irregularis]|uniref:Uncharacterized protein n=1 Tax=Rhizophagus irregularis TaxID=588596 RepID=A0A2I1H3S9_9GLOM|nr:hypothetical protein RhiirC2_797720 [Rhizophagus irregularis]PKY53521.1 hypothetical protein RhiirA4_471789 [Rhizophagus irregularis]CAB4382707.1 unnamed protein product [Rhizophagus irregularis]CAB4426907.1 unnamed protein product [Rhizophagus irregularis]CAB5371836.1 unnamed protein product [Rhizophagus irregularis]